MVLIKKLVIKVFLFFSTICFFAQDAGNAEYATSVIRQVLYESPEGIILNNNIENTDISFKQQKKIWIPNIQLDLSGSSDLIQGDYNYIRNGGILPGPQSIINPSMGISISQYLPGNGQVSMNMGYGLSYLVGQSGFMQKPYIQIGFAQTLSYGAFGITEDPTIKQFNNQLLLSKLEYDKAKFDLISRFISTVQNYDIAKLEYEYYEIMLTKANAEYLEQSKRHKSGQYSNIDLFNSHMQMVQAKQNLQQARQKLIQTRTLLDIYECDTILDKTGLFRDDVLILLNLEYDRIFKKTVQEYELLYEIEDEKLSYKIDKMNLAPSIYLEASVTPDQNQYNLYSDFSRSLRDLVNSSSVWSVNASLGFRMKLDLMMQGKALKDMSEKKIQNLNLQLDILREEEKRMRNLYQEWSVSFTEFCKDLDKSMKEEEEFLRDMKNLLEKNLITEAQYWGAELSYHEICLNYYRNVWNMIQGKIQILSLTSDWTEFLNLFLEVNK
ncbi:MAG: TolC family protein [Treponema sp.]|nr:TolC family protein [Treponema sp.]